jgi:hypothetical protein
MMTGPQQHCADKLLLVDEMLRAAGDYLTVCRGLLDDEDSVMARLAYDHILGLRNQVGQLTKKIDGLEAELRRMLTERLAEKREDSVPHKTRRARHGWA